MTKTLFSILDFEGKGWIGIKNFETQNHIFQNFNPNGFPLEMWAQEYLQASLKEKLLAIKIGGKLYEEEFINWLNSELYKIYKFGNKNTAEIWLGQSGNNFEDLCGQSPFASYMKKNEIPIHDYLSEDDLSKMNNSETYTISPRNVENSKEDFEAGQWTQVFTSDGEQYYHDTLTDKTTWEIPSTDNIYISPQDLHKSETEAWREIIKNKTRSYVIEKMNKFEAEALSIINLKRKVQDIAHETHANAIDTLLDAKTHIHAEDTTLVEGNTTFDNLKTLALAHLSLRASPSDTKIIAWFVSRYTMYLKNTKTFEMPEAFTSKFIESFSIAVLEHELNHQKHRLEIRRSKERKSDDMLNNVLKPGEADYDNMKKNINKVNPVVSVKNKESKIDSFRTTLSPVSTILLDTNSPSLYPAQIEKNEVNKIIDQTMSLSLEETPPPPPTLEHTGNEKIDDKFDIRT